MCTDSLLRCILIISGSLACISPIAAQNRIPNPGFEAVTGMPYQGNQLNLAPPWSNCNGNYTSFMVGTPDLYHANANNQLDVPANFLGYCNAHSGNAITGLVTWNDNYTDYREYMSVNFIAPLVAGEAYTFSFWASNGTNLNYKYITNNLGVVFSVAQPSQSGWNLINAIPQFEITTWSNTPGWVQYTYSFTAAAAFNYMTIGNFRTDAQTLHTLVGSNQPYGYFFLDDFCLVEDDISLMPGDCNIPYSEAAIQEGTNEGLATVFPNPSTGFVTFQWSAGFEAHSIGIYDGRGRLVILTDVENEYATSHWVDVSMLAEGIYYYRIESRKGAYAVGKLVVDQND